MPDLAWQRAVHTTGRGFLPSCRRHGSRGVLLRLWRWPSAERLLSLPTSKRMGWAFKNICVFDNADPTLEQGRLRSHFGASARCCGRDVLGEPDGRDAVPRRTTDTAGGETARCPPACVLLSSTAMSSCPLAFAFLYIPLPKT